MAPPKKQSGFMVFVNNWRENTAEGRNMSIPEAVSHCSGMWEKLTEDQRDPFNDAAKRDRGQGSANKKPKTADQVQRELAEKELQIKRSIEGIVMNGKKAHDLENSKFVFVAFNYFTKLHNSHDYVPAEFAACQYTLKDGITSMFSSLINPGRLHVGQNRDAQEHSATTHLLPLPPQALGESDMEKLHTEMVEYLTQCQTTRPLVVFTATDMVPMVKSCFSYLATEAEGDARNGALHRIVVFDLQYLLFVLKREVLDVAGLPNDKLNIHITNEFFSRDFFEFTNHIACEFHEEMDKSKYCAQSMVMRWGYTFSDYMCGDLGIDVVPGRHIPSNAKANNAEILSAATSRVSLRGESSIDDSFHSLQSLKGLRVSEANKQANRRRENSPASTNRSSATDYTDLPSEDCSSRGGPSLRGLCGASGGARRRL